MWTLGTRLTSVKGVIMQGPVMSSSGAMSVVGVFRKQTRSTSHTIGNGIGYIDVASFVNHRTKQDVYDDLESGKESSTVDGN